MEEAGTGAPQPLPVPSSWSILTLAEPKAMCRGGGGTMEWEGKELKALGNAEKYGKRKVGVSVQAKEWMSISCPGSSQIEDHGLQSGFFSQFSFTYPLLIPHSFFWWTCKAFIPAELLILTYSLFRETIFSLWLLPHKSNLSILSVLKSLIMAAIPTL